MTERNGTTPAPTGATPEQAPQRRTHLFYEGAMRQLREQGEPAQALCGYVLRRGGTAVKPAAAVACPACEIGYLELLWVQS